MRTSLPVTRTFEQAKAYLLGSILPGMLFFLALYFFTPESPTKVLSAALLAFGSAIPSSYIISMLWKKFKRAEQDATTDTLSGLLNRRGAQEALQMEFGLISRERHHEKVELSLVVIDLDFFSSLNNECGHQAGDAAIRNISEYIRKKFHRKTDICCRYGGDEFIVILPETPIEAAHAMTEHLRQLVEKTYASQKVQITLSCGVTSKLMAPAEILRHTAGDEETLEVVKSLLEIADHALYLSKGNGRNRVTSVPSRPPYFKMPVA